MRRSLAVIAFTSVVGCGNRVEAPPDEPGDDDPTPPAGWAIDVDLSGLDRFAGPDAASHRVAGGVTGTHGPFTIDVGGAGAMIGGTGAFQRDVALAPGLNPVPIAARDSAGHTRQADRSIIAATYLPAGRLNPQAAALVVTDAVVAALGEGLAGQAGTVDVAGEIENRDVLSSDSQCTTWPLAASQGQVQVRLRVDQGELWLNIRIPNLHVDFGGQCQGLLSTIPIAGEMGGTLDVWTRLTARPQPGACLTAFAHTAPQVQVNGWYFDVWGTSGPLQAWLVQLFSGSKSAEAREQLRGEVATRAQSLLTTQLAAVTVFDRTSPLELLGRPLDLHLCVADLTKVGTRLVSTVAAAAVGRGSSSAPGAPQTAGAVPVATTGELVLDGNLVAQLLFAAWQDGGLRKPGIEELDLATLNLVAPELANHYPADAKVIASLDGELPAVVRATPDGPGDLRVELGDLMVDLAIGDDRLFRVAAVLRLDLELVPTGNALVPTVVASTATAAVIDERYDGADAILANVVAGKVQEQASALLSGAAIALPQLPGVGAPTAVTADAGGRYLRVRLQ